MPDKTSKGPFAQRLDHFWTSFAQQVETLSGDQKKLIGWLSEQIDILQPGLSWDVGPWTSGKMNLAITCENQYHLRPLVDEIIDKAPVLEGWTFSSARPPIPAEMVANVFNSRTKSALPDCAACCSPTELNYIDIEFDFASAALKIPKEHLFVLLEIILGEKFLEVWVGEIRSAKKLFGFSFGGKRTQVPLEGLRDHCEQLKVEMLKRSTPDTFYFEQPRPDTGALFTLNGNITFPDRWTINTWCPEVMKATLAERFWSERYSRNGETFCFLQIEGEYDLDKRSEVENALDAVLRSHKVGCVIGSGTGTQSVFIDLALTNFETGHPFIKEFVSTLKDPCKLHFFDIGYRQVVLAL